MLVMGVDKSESVKETNKLLLRKKSELFQKIIDSPFRG